MSFDLQAILALGEVDRKLHRARKRLAKASHIAAPQRSRVEMVEAELKKLKDEAKHHQLHLKTLEGDQKAKEADIQKAQVTLNAAKNNDEYQSLLRTIDTRSKELSEIETQILQFYEAQEAREAREAACKDRLASQQKELKSAEGRVSEEESKVKAEIEGLEAERAAAAEKVDKKYLDLYDRLATKHENVTAEVIDEMCQGCFVKVRPNQVSLVRGGKEIVTCIECGRILLGRFG